MMMGLDTIWNFCLIVFGFGLLIGIHELGHFLAAKWAGIRTNAFAIGMGPVFFSYRKGIGISRSSSKNKLIAKFGKDAPEMSDAELETNGLSETEYSLRYLPIGGFVSMLGQEDGKPDVQSQDPRSYNRCSIGKRMVVVSAGVCMNVLLAIVLFLICFQIGVRFEAPIIGQIIPNSPAARSLSIGENPSNLQPSDVIVAIDGKPVSTFTDVQIAGAMAKPGVPVVLEVKRNDDPDVLTYSITPGSVTQSGLLELGLFPASSLTIREGKEFEESFSILQEQHESLRVVKQGMKLTGVNERLGEQVLAPVSQWDLFQSILSINYARGNTIETRWSDGGETVTVHLPLFPELNILRPVGVPEGAPQNYEFGLLGLVPLAKVSFVLDTSPNVGVLHKGDVITRVEQLHTPRMGQLRNYLTTQIDGSISLTVLRDGISTEVHAELNQGMLGVLLVNALDIPMIAQPLEEVLVDVDGNLVPMPTAIAGLKLKGGETILGAQDANRAGKQATNWASIRSSIRWSGQWHGAKGPVSLLVKNDASSEVVELELDPKEGELTPFYRSGWATPLNQQMFEPLFVVRSSGGNPVEAMKMGVDETINMIVMTYLTVDRLFRRTVGVDQLRGPIGIVDIGFKIADRGMSYLLFFLAIISVNLAVLNFLPLPIVDGGLFLYLIYEKLIGKPPSIAFQNAAAVLGLGLLGTLFVVTFYNDIMRIVG
jgi:regulator of sigma E protease